MYITETEKTNFIAWAEKFKLNVRAKNKVYNLVFPEYKKITRQLKEAKRNAKEFISSTTKKPIEIEDFIVKDPKVIRLTRMKKEIEPIVRQNYVYRNEHVLYCMLCGRSYKEVENNCRIKIYIRIAQFQKQSVERFDQLADVWLARGDVSYYDLLDEAIEIDKKIQHAESLKGMLKRAKENYDIMDDEYIKLKKRLENWEAEKEGRLANIKKLEEEIQTCLDNL